MGIILQAEYLTGPNLSVPSPYDRGTPDVDWWWDHIAKQAQDFAEVGFSAILTPPPLKTNAGAFPGATGYGTWDHYDLGNKNWWYSIPTRFGSKEQLQRLVAVAHSNGIAVYTNIVNHQCCGGDNGVYNYVGSDGKTLNGRFPKIPSYFEGQKLVKGGVIGQDPIIGPVADDTGAYAFGDRLGTVTSLPKGEVEHQLILAGDWLTLSLDVDGGRIDDIKGQVAQSVKNWACARSMSTRFYVGEYSDGNPNTLAYVADDLDQRLSLFDFNVHYTLKAMCNQGSNFDMTQLDHLGLAGINPLKAVTFVESPDTDVGFMSQVVWNKILGYAYILTTEGYPCVYYKDYSTDKGCYGLKPLIDNLVWISNNFSSGPTIYRHKEYQFVVYERPEGGLLVGLNNDLDPAWKTVTVATNFGPNVQLHDYTGNNTMDCWTDEYGNVTFGIPPNNNGNGYVCWARADFKSTYKPTGWSTSQVFFGAVDLDIPQAHALEEAIGRIYAEAHTSINLTHDSTISVRIEGPDGNILGTNKALVRGWHTLLVKSVTNKPTDFALKVNYIAPRTI